MHLLIALMFLASPAPMSSEDLVFEGTVTKVVIARTHSRRGWAVTMRVDKVVSGKFSGSTFAFLVHSPARAGLSVGVSCTVKATWTGRGYDVDENQWLGHPGR